MITFVSYLTKQYVKSYMELKYATSGFYDNITKESCSSI